MPIPGGVSVPFGDADGNPTGSVDPTAFQVWASTNLSTWFYLDALPCSTNGLLRFDDTDAQTAPATFYRIISQ